MEPPLRGDPTDRDQVSAKGWPSSPTRIEGIDDAGWGERERAFGAAMAVGASGIKIFKALGLGVRLKSGKLSRSMRAPRPDLKRAAETGAIVAWHVADRDRVLSTRDQGQRAL